MEAIVYTTIANWDGTIELSGGLDFNEEGNLKPRISWISLEFKDLEITWDVGEYIFNEFHYFLLNWKSRIITVEQATEFAVFIPYLTEDKVEDLLEILETAKKLEWNK